MRYFIAAAVLGILACLVQCEKLGFHHWEWHQKLTVIVDTPNGLKTGSSVVGIEMSVGPRWSQLIDAGRLTMRGEAAAVEVSRGKYLFALLDNYDGSTALEMFPMGGKPRGMEEEEYYRRIDEMVASRQTVVLPVEYYPLLVSFRDLSNPMSVVAPGPVSFKGLDFPTVAKPRDLSRVFGPGYSIRSITLSIVDDDVTEGVIDPILPWLDQYRDKAFDGRTIRTIKATNQLANSLGAGSFRIDN
ncbi:hypothetical protein [Rhizobium altiplani]|nr:hypothetical protein [Rhizobium altiplani]